MRRRLSTRWRSYRPGWLSALPAPTKVMAANSRRNSLYVTPSWPLREARAAVWLPSSATCPDTASGQPARHIHRCGAARCRNELEAAPGSPCHRQFSLHASGLRPRCTAVPASASALQGVGFNPAVHAFPRAFSRIRCVTLMCARHLGHFGQDGGAGGAARPVPWAGAHHVRHPALRRWAENFKP